MPKPQQKGPKMPRKKIANEKKDQQDHGVKKSTPQIRQEEAEKILRYWNVPDFETKGAARQMREQGLFRTGTR
jgi:hypothetical protein